MTRIPEKDPATLAEVVSKAAIRFPAADMHAPDGGGKGLSRHYAADVLYQALAYQISTHTGHGLTSGSVGYPLWYGSVVDDTDLDHYPSGVLVEVIDTDTLRIAPPGSEVTLPVALLEDGNATDIGTTGRFMYWDFSATQYMNDLPVDSSATMPEMLELISVGSTTFTARVRGY